MNPPDTPPNPPNKFVSRRSPLALVAIVVAIYAVGIGGAVIYDRSKTPEYEATAKLKISQLRPPLIGWEPGSDSPGIVDSNEFDTKIAAMRSAAIIARVATRSSDMFVPAKEIEECLKITPDWMNGAAVVRYRNPDREAAIKMANCFVDEILLSNGIEPTKLDDPTLEKLGIRINRIKTDIGVLVKKRSELVEKTNLRAFFDNPRMETTETQKQAYDKALSDYGALSKEIKIREDNFAALAQVYERKRTDAAGHPPVRTVPSAIAGNEPVNRNLGLAVAVGAAGATAVNIGVVAVVGTVFAVRRSRRNRRERSAT